MKTADLIEALARNSESTDRSALGRRVLGAVLLGGLAALGLLSVTLGVRPDIGVAIGTVMLKAGFSALIGVVAFAGLVRLARPGPAGGPLAGTGVLLAGLVAAICLVVAVSLAAMRPEMRFSAWMGAGIPWCVVLIPAFALPVAGGLAWAFREAAPTRLVVTGAFIGAASGSVGAIVYGLYCPVDSAAFVATWYAAGIAVAAALGALAGRWILRW
jgi:hypothetical protein